MPELHELAEPSLAELADTAVADTDPAEVMPPVDGEPGWTPARRQAFLEFHRGRSIGTARPVETTYVIRAHGRVVGAARLEPSGDDLTAGVWIGRSARGGGIGRAVLAELTGIAARRGATRLVAETTTGNHAARAMLAGFDTTVHGDRVSATLELHPALAASVVLITGIQAAGKSTVAQLLAERLPRSTHVRGDIYRRMVVRGRAEMTEDADEEALRQLRLRYRLAVHTANAYAAAGFTAVLQDVVLGEDLAELAGAVTECPCHVVVLDPEPAAVLARETGRNKVAYGRWTVDGLADVLRTQTPRIGLWLDTTAQTPEQTVREILDRAPTEARVR